MREQAVAAAQQLLLLLLLLVLHTSRGLEESACRPYKMELPQCKKNITHTMSPPEEQRQMNSTVNGLLRIQELYCAPYIDILVCSMVLQPCYSHVKVSVRTCRSFCMKVRDLCSEMMALAGNPWPDRLDCQTLPEDSTQKMCIKPEKEHFKAAMRALLPRRQQRMLELRRNGTSAKLPTPPSTTSKTPETAAKTSCSAAELQLGHGPAASCAQRCTADLLFTSEDKRFAEVWMLLWSVVCLVCTGLAVATFALDSGRFHYPERPMVWVAASYFLFSCGHLLRAGFGQELACGRSQAAGAAAGDAYLISRHAGHWCAVVFLLLYFSSLAGCMWWAVLSVCYYLCAVHKWVHEGLNRRSMTLHVCAWGVPLLLSVVLLVLHRIEGDELTHLCQVDGSDRSNMLVFVIAPNALILLAGLIFLVRAVATSASVRHCLKDDGNYDYRRLEKLMTKITMYSVLFGLPSLCVLAINIYEYLLRDTWTASLEEVLRRPGCTNSSGILPLSSCDLKERPLPALFMLKVFMSLAVGMPSGLLVWFNCKSASAWRRCLCRLLPGSTKQHQQQQLHQQQLQQQQQQQQLGRSSAYSPVLPEPSGLSPRDWRPILGSSLSKYPHTNAMLSAGAQHSMGMSAV